MTSFRCVPGLGGILGAGRARPGASGNRARAPGFTLIETAMTTVIIGVGVLAVVEAQQSFLQRNSWSTSASTATYLANEIRELTKHMPRHDRFSGGIYFTDPADASTFTGWGPEAGETEITDLDDLDDFDGAVFGAATTLPSGFTMSSRYGGPINAFGEVIPQTLYDGTTEMATDPDGDPAPVSMRGWTQLVTVQKVNPYDINEVVADSAQQTQGATIERAVDRYPVRVTVAVLYQPDANTAPETVTRVSWIVMP